jgi:hypothetical protein
VDGPEKPSYREHPCADDEASKVQHLTPLHPTKNFTTKSQALPSTRWEARVNYVTVNSFRCNFLQFAQERITLPSAYEVTQILKFTAMDLDHTAAV